MSTDPLPYVLASLRRAADNGYSWSLTPTEAGALVAEVERLRAQRALDNEALARAWDESRDMERAAVVAWLRNVKRTYNHGSRLITSVLCQHGDAIERGEHRRGETK
jgi:hypothetical protein